MTSVIADKSVPLPLPRWLLVATLLELFLGGNGRLTEISGVRLRLVLSAVCLVWAVLNLLARPRMRLSGHVWALLLLFFTSTLLGVSNGLANGNIPAEIVSELKGLLYFPMLLVFAMAIRTHEDVHLVIRILILCASIQTVIFLGLLALSHAGILSYISVFHFLRQSEEFIFRPGSDETYFLGFFYTGTFDLAIAALFLLFVPQYRNYGLAALVFVAILLTETRGILVAACLATFAGLLNRRSWLGYLGLGMATLALMLLMMFTNVFESFSRPVSDSVRLNDIRWLMQHFEPVRIVFGYGMGAPIGDRSRIEMTFLEIFYKQGLIGLLPWVAIYMVNLVLWLAAKRYDAQLALSLHLCTLYVFIATTTNNFLIGPLGMCIVLLSTVSLNVLRQHHWRTAATGVNHA